MKTLSQYLEEAGCEEDLKRLIEIISQQAPQVRLAFLENRGYVGEENTYGEKLKKMDTWSDNHFTETVKNSGLVKELSSEERNEVVKFDSAKSDLSVAMDPMDGSSSIDVNLTVGSIFGIYRGSVLQKGENLLAAFYMLYGPKTTLTITIGKGTHIFSLDKNGVYVLTEENVVIPEGKIYGSGGTKNQWLEFHDKCMNYVVNNDYKIRYTGTFVADIQQILKYGGLYAYPATKENPDGKIRLLFESAPVGFIVKQAGGLVTDGKNDLLAVEPKVIRHRTPIYIGSKGLIEKLKEFSDD